MASIAVEDNGVVSRTTTFQWVRGELIAKGSYGRVYLALNVNSGELMAVKQVETPQTASDRADSRQTEVVEALKFESKTLKDLEHVNIVQYLGFEETPENLNIFLEYVPGGTIGSCLLRHGAFDKDVTKFFTAQILAGLEYLHSTGIIHRDLKGDNILVETSGVCKISDFGISKKEDVKGQAFTELRGTVYWMAPEVVDSNKKGYDSKVDIWSLGCVVLEMWTGGRPWAGEEVISVMLKLYKDKLPPPVPSDLLLDDLAMDFRHECFAMNPQARPTAGVLRQHPYLKLTCPHVFAEFDIYVPRHFREHQDLSVTTASKIVLCGESGPR
ncbi:kinase-like protein [Mycena latifolia]|nr:kinase-like protein [Mycena latifolia]